jgi:hypothetical protein
MDFFDLTLRPQILRLKAAEVYCGGQQNLKNLRRVGWITPLIQHKSNTSFDVRDLDLAIDHAQLNGWPHGDS